MAKAIVARPLTSMAPGDGLLRSEHFQVAYVTNDIARACDVFRDRYGVKDFLGMDSATPEGGAIRIELAWVGGTQFELIQSSGPGTEFYTDRLPAEGFAIRHHHLGYFIHDQAGWDGLMEKISQEGRRIVFQGHLEGFLRFCYIEAEELGHYLEWIFPEAGGVAFFEGVPAT